MARAKQGKTIHQMTFAQWEAAFPDEDACAAYLVATPLARWRRLPPLRQRQSLRLE